MTGSHDETKAINPTDQVTREEIHFRRIDMRGWLRSDGLYEIEGRVTDTKPHDFKAPNGPKVVPAGEPLHDMGVTLVFDTSMLVHEVRVFMASTPYEPCVDASDSLQVLKGLRIAGGWAGEVRKRLAGPLSCTT